MNSREHRFDTMPVEVGKHLVPEEKRPREGFREHRVPRWIYRVALILALCALGVLGWYNRENLAPENAWQWLKSNIVGVGIGDGFPRTFSGSTVEPGNFLSLNKNVVFASDTSLALYNPTGKELLNIQHSYSSPVLRAGGAHLMLYNLGGKNCMLETAGGDSLKPSIDQNILGGAVAANGRSALITEADGYCGKLTAYDSSAQVVSRYWFSDYYPTAVALNPSGTKAAVTGVSAKEGNLVSAVYIIDLTSGKIVQPAAVCSGNLLSVAFWETESSVAAIGDTGAVFLDLSSGLKRDFDFDGSQLTAFCADGGRVALGLMPYEGSEDQSFLVLDASGGKIFSKRFSGKILSVSLSGQTAAVLSKGKVSFFSLASADDSGKTEDAGDDACAVALKDESSAYVLGISEVRCVNRW